MRARSAWRVGWLITACAPCEAATTTDARTLASPVAVAYGAVSVPALPRGCSHFAGKPCHVRVFCGFDRPKCPWHSCASLWRETLRVLGSSGATWIGRLAAAFDATAGRCAAVTVTRQSAVFVRACRSFVLQ